MPMLICFLSILISCSNSISLLHTMYKTHACQSIHFIAVPANAVLAQADWIYTVVFLCFLTLS